MKVIEKRAADEGLCALGLRFSGDPMAPEGAVQDAQGPAR